MVCVFWRKETGYICYLLVGIPSSYGLDGPGIESGGGGIFRTCPDRPWGPPSLLYNGYWVLPWGLRAAGT